MLIVVGRAEVESSWEELLASFRERLPHDRFLLPRQPGRVPTAWIEVGAADPVELTLREGLLLIQARSGAWGPGYHEQVVRLFDALGEALPRGGWEHVEDGTDHYRERDRARLERVFLRYAHALWDPDLALTGLSVGLGVGEGPASVPPGMVATPVGFKSASWIRQTREALRRALHGSPGQDPGPLSRAAREAFLWWRAEPDAFDWIQLGRVLCTCDVIWRPLDSPDAPEQVEVRERAYECFAAALRLDPQAPVPWAELERLSELTGRELPARPVQEAPESGRFRGGYREGWIRRQVGEWNLALPGWLRARCDDDGHEVFYDDRITVHVSARRGEGRFPVEAEVARHLAALPPSLANQTEVLKLERGSLSGYTLVIAPQENKPVAPRQVVVQGQRAFARERASFTVLLSDAKDRELALRLGQSLRPLEESARITRPS